MSARVDILAFTDGAAKGNPGPGGWGAVLLVAGQTVRELGGSGGVTTNNRMELEAAIATLEWATEASAADSVEVTVLSDSTYLLRGVGEWLPAWKRRGWKTATGADVANRELWERLDAAVARCARVTWRHVAGHAGCAGNERADRIASDLAEGRHVALYEGPACEYELDLVASAEVAGDPRLARSARPSRRRGVATRYLSLVAGELARHDTWADCERRVKGRPGARYRKVASEAEERAILGEWGVAGDGAAVDRRR